jgi:hypothetical protein
MVGISGGESAVHGPDFAAFIMRADRWNAGAALMQAQSPEAWRALMDAGKLSSDNSVALAACREAPAKAKKEQRCILVVPAS